MFSGGGGFVLPQPVGPDRPLVAATALSALTSRLVTRPYLYAVSRHRAAAVRAFDMSFPGGVTVRIVLVAAVLAAVFPRLLTPAILWAVGALALLVLAGLHTPSDIGGGLLLATSLIAAATAIRPRQAHA